MNCRHDTKRAYGLDGLKDRDFVFVRPVDSPIVDVHLRKLRLALPDAEAVRVTVEVDRDRSVLFIARSIGSFPVPTDEATGSTCRLAKVIGATIAATIDRRGDRKPAAGRLTSRRVPVRSSTTGPTCCCATCCATAVSTRRPDAVMATVETDSVPQYAARTAGIRLAGCGAEPMVFGLDDLEEATSQALARLAEAGLIEPAEAAREIICDGCDWGCLMPVEIVGADNGGRRAP